MAGLGLLTGCGLPPLPWQQPARIPRVGFLNLVAQIYYEAFRGGLRELGYVEGQNVILEYRQAEGKAERVSDLTAELIQLQVDLIVAVPGLAARGVRQVTDTIPIVAAYGDLVGLGLVTSLAHPDGNITGLSAVTSELSAKRLQLLKEALTTISRVAVLWYADGIGQTVKETEAAGRALGMELQILGVRDPSEFEPAFAAMNAERAEALVVLPAAIFGGAASAALIADLALKHRLPTMFEGRGYTDAGGLMAYGPNLLDLARRSATYADKIIKGAKPGDLPVEQPTKFDFVINLKTAQALGLAITPAILQQATDVIR